MIFNDFAKIILTFHRNAAVILLDGLYFSCRNTTFDRKKSTALRNPQQCLSLKNMMLFLLIRFLVRFFSTSYFLQFLYSLNFT